ncbi:MAG: thiamine phosphate synthase [Sandaracinus sp.]|nr:thiamine phosphate synthase [Sandaracinus sp.]MCB9621750.1 thiamine phosphate synthase [Sandaracinus sp.]MCB9632249.1 thiamine phosphate synthase [Sandaracinus sp.]
MIPKLLWITPESEPLGPMLATLEGLVGLDAGLEALAVLLRRPGAPGRQWLAEARALQATGVPLFVSGHLDVALAAGAAGVQLPERGVEVAEARRLFGGVVGVSRHDRAGLEHAAAQGADYATLSPFDQVPGKGRALGPEGFAGARRGISLPVLALGGITPATAGAARAAGADGFAVLRGGNHLRALAGLLASP